MVHSDGTITKLIRKLARKCFVILIASTYEEDLAGVYYNSAAVIDANGSHPGLFRKMHIPHYAPGFGRNSTFAPGILGTQSSTQPSDVIGA